MVEGLTSSATDQGSFDPGQAGILVIHPLAFASTTTRIGDLDRRPAPVTAGAKDAAETHPDAKILVTLAERPHPFPSRTRKLSSPAPKILRGQPFGKIGRRQDFCVSRGRHAMAGLPGCRSSRSVS